MFKNFLKLLAYKIIKVFLIPNLYSSIKIIDQPAVLEVLKELNLLKYSRYEGSYGYGGGKWDKGHVKLTYGFIGSIFVIILPPNLAPSNPGQDLAYAFQMLAETAYHKESIGTIIAPFVSCEKLLEAFKEEHSKLYKKESKKYIIQVQCAGSSHFRILDKEQNDLEIAILPEEIEKDLYSDIEKFLEAKEEYTKRGIAYRRGYVFHGPPGTGKSSVIRHIANKYKLDVRAYRSLDQDFQISNNGRVTILTVEDIDTIFDKRKAVSPGLSHLNFGCFLNIIDGIEQTEDFILILTTNNLECIDPALMRPGRIDKVFYLDKADKSQLYRIFLRMYPGELEAAQLFADSIEDKKYTLAEIESKLLQTCSVKEALACFDV